MENRPEVSKDTVSEGEEVKVRKRTRQGRRALWEGS